MLLLFGIAYLYNPNDRRVFYLSLSVGSEIASVRYHSYEWRRLRPIYISNALFQISYLIVHLTDKRWLCTIVTRVKLKASHVLRSVTILLVVYKSSVYSIKFSLHASIDLVRCLWSDHCVINRKFVFDCDHFEIFH